MDESQLLDKLANELKAQNLGDPAGLLRLVGETNAKTALKVVQAFRTFLQTAMTFEAKELNPEGTKAIGAAAHRLKPTSQMIGFTFLHSICEKIDARVKKEVILQKDDADLLEWYKRGKEILNLLQSTLGQIP